MTFSFNQSRVKNKEFPGVSLSLDSVLGFPIGFHASHINFVANDTVVNKAGMGLQIHDLATSRQVVHGTDVGVSCVTVHRKRHLIAYTEDTLEPQIVLLRFNPSLFALEPVARFPTGSPLPATAIAFSRSGARIAVLGDMPEYTLTVFETDTGKTVVKMPTTDLGGNSLGNTVSFDPRDGLTLCTSGEGKLAFWRIDEHFDSVSVTKIPAVIPQQHEELEMSIHTWDAQGSVYVGTVTGELLQFDAATGQCLTEEAIFVPEESDPTSPDRETPVDKPAPQRAVAALITTRNHVIVVFVSGLMRWFSLADHSLCWMHELGAQVTDAVIDTGLYARFAVTLATGEIKIVDILASIPADASSANDIDGDPIGTSSLGEFHSARITGIAGFPNYPLAAACDASGCMKIWDLSGKYPVFSTRFAAGLSCIAVNPRGDLIALGTETGVVRVFLFKPPKGGEYADPILLSRFRLSATASAQKLAFNRDSSMLAVSCSDAKIHFLTWSDSAKSFDMLGYLDIGTNINAICWNPSNQAQIFITLENGGCHRYNIPENPKKGGGSAAAGGKNKTSGGGSGNTSGSATPGDGSTASAAAAAAERYRLDPYEAGKSIMRMEHPAYGIVLTEDGSNDERYHHFYVFCADKRVKQYTMLEEAGNPDLVDADAINPPNLELEGHEKAGGDICLSNNGRFLATGASDGMIWIRSMESLEKAKMVRRHDIASGGISCLTFANDAQFIVSAGADSTLFIWNLTAPKQQQQQGREKAMGASLANVNGPAKPIKDSDDPKEGTFFDRLAMEAVDSLNAERALARQRMLDSLTALRNKFREILRKNETVSELERLHRDDFVIDIEARDALVALGEVEVAKVKAQIEKENTGIELVCDRIKHETWDVMEVKGVCVRGLSSQAKVYNYPLRKLEEAEERRHMHAKNLRISELSALRIDKQRKLEEEKGTAGAGKPGMQAPAVSTANLASGYNSNVSMVSGVNSSVGGNNAGSSAAAAAARRDSDEEGKPEKAPDVENLESVAQGEAVAHADAEADNDDEDEQEPSGDQLLFDELELFSANRKMLQIQLLHGLIRDTKRGFNAELETFMHQKRLEMEKIDLKADRLAEINVELKDSETPVFRPKLQDDEVPERVLSVQDEEVTVERVLTKAEREARDRQRQLEEEALSNQKKDDSAERALKMMMGGRLHQDKEKDLEEDLVPPEWMVTTHKEDMSEDQLKQVKEFEKAVQTRNEEKEKRRKALETEQKKIIGQIQEICDVFDGQLKEIKEKKTAADRKVFQYELNIINLSKSLLKEENDERKERKLLADLERLKSEKRKTTSALTEFKRELDQYKETFDNLVLEDKVIEKGFRKDFQALLTTGTENATHFDILLKFFKRRAKPKKIEAIVVDDEQSPDPFSKFDNPGPGSGAGTQPGSMNATGTGLAATMGASAGAVENVPDVIDPSECPEGLPDGVWDKFTEYRNRKIQSEQDIKRRSVVLAEMNKNLNRLTDLDEAARTKIEENTRKLSEFRDERMKMAANLEKLFVLKQGQVEVEQEAVVTDYADAVLINRGVVTELNDRIHELGKEKLEILYEIRDLRKAIKVLEWENTYLDMTAEDLVSKSRDFQLLRVTKSLQELIKGGGKNKHAAEISMLDKKSEHSRKVHEDKLEDKRGTLKKLKTLIKEKDKDNEKLSMNISSLEISVNERKNIYELQTQTQGITGDAKQKRFNDIHKQKQLIMIVKQQTEEIDFLKNELERLRLRTFPSFAVNVMQQNIINSNPDERA